MNVSIFNIENWREISSTLARNKTRTLLTAFGIFWGTAMLAMLLGGAQGFKGIMYRNFAGLATNMGGIFAGQRSQSYLGYNKGSQWSITTEDVDVLRKVGPAIEYISPMVQSSANAAYGTKTKSARAIGVQEDYNRMILPVVTAGRLINEADVRQKAKVAVVGKNIAADLFGGDDPVGKYFTINGVHFRCVGVAGQQSEVSLGGRIDDNFLLPESTLRLVFGRGNNVDFVVFTAPSGTKPSANEEIFRRTLAARHAFARDDNNAVGFMDISENFEIIDNVFLGISILAFFVGFASLMAGVIGVGNIMWIVVKERTHEFGIRRAIGAKASDITVQVLSESIVLTLIAGTAGVCFAAMILATVDNATIDPLRGKAGFEISFWLAIGIVVAFFILGSAAGTLPAIKAMRIKPIEAIRDK